MKLIWKLISIGHWFKKSIYNVVHQSETKSKPCLFPPYVRVAGVLDVFALSYDWFIRLSAPAVIGYRQVFFVSSFKPSVVFRFLRAPLQTHKNAPIIRLCRNSSICTFIPTEPFCQNYKTLISKCTNQMTLSRAPLI